MNLYERRAVYLTYLEMKVAEQDWHGVMDCAADLREIEAAIAAHSEMGVLEPAEHPK